MKYCLNTSTIQGEKIPIWEQVEIAKRAGYDGIEIWLRDVDKFEKKGKAKRPKEAYRRFRTRCGKRDRLRGMDH